MLCQNDFNSQGFRWLTCHDADANLTAGKYYSLQKGDWDKGLPLLAKGNDNLLKQLASTDLTRPGEAAAQVAMGEAWLAVLNAVGSVLLGLIAVWLGVRLAQSF